jgi:hypothetical protein
VALGINFESIIARQSAGDFLKERFLVKGSWDSKDHPLETVRLKFIYPIDRGRFTLELYSVTNRADSTKTGVMAKGNFHRDITDPREPAGQIADYLLLAEKDYLFYERTVSDSLSIAR